MDEDTMNLQIRRFLKKVGVNAQREMERAIRDAHAAGGLRDGAPLQAVMRLDIEALGLEVEIRDTIAYR